MAISDETKRYQEQLTGMESNAPAAYSSKYGTTIDNLMNQISNRTFSYDFNADPLYQQYKDNYTKMGKEASMNAVANASNMTGGYANSYAATAGAQANQQYMTQLNNVIPELYQAALDKYNAETNQLQNQFDMYSTAENMNYNQYMDTVNKYNTDRNYYQNAYQNSVANDQWGENMQFQRDEAAREQNNWQTQFDYNKDQDKLAQENWQTQFDYQKDQDKLAQQNWETQFNYNKEQDALAQENWQKQFDENVRQFGLDYALQKAQVDLQNAKFEYDKAQNEKAAGTSNADYSNYVKTLTGTISRTQRSSSGTLGRDVLDGFKNAAREVGMNGASEIIASLLNSGKISMSDADEMWDYYTGSIRR